MERVQKPLRRCLLVTRTKSRPDVIAIDEHEHLHLVLVLVAQSSRNCILSPESSLLALMMTTMFLVVG
jgi:hypothetical protein